MIRNKVYKEIRDKLRDGFSDLNYIDMQKGQFRKASENYPIPMPAALIEFKPAAWGNTTGGQISEATISVYLYLDLVTDSFNDSEQESETIELLDKQDKIFETLQGFSGTYHNPLIRTFESTVYEKTYAVFITDFKTLITHEVMNKKTAKPDINLLTNG